MKFFFDILFYFILIQAAVSDWHTKTIKNRYPAAILMMALVMMGKSEFPEAVLKILGGAAAGAGPLFVASLLVRGSFGGGDIKLMAAAGCYLGPIGGFYGLFAGLLSGAVYGIYLKCLKKQSWKQTIPLGPFLVVGLGAVNISMLF